METKYYLIRKKYDQQQIAIFYIHIKQQLADLLTKVLPRETFQHLRDQQDLVAPPSRTSGRVSDNVLAEVQQSSYYADNMQTLILFMRKV